MLFLLASCSASATFRVCSVCSFCFISRTLARTTSRKIAPLIVLDSDRFSPPVALRDVVLGVVLVVLVVVGLFVLFVVFRGVLFLL
jgi:hypothetical protein